MVPSLQTYSDKANFYFHRKQSVSSGCDRLYIMLMHHIACHTPPSFDSGGRRIQPTKQWRGRRCPVPKGGIDGMHAEFCRFISNQQQGDYHDASQHPQQVHAKFAPPGCTTRATREKTTCGAVACCQSWSWLVSLKMYQV